MSLSKVTKTHFGQALLTAVNKCYRNVLLSIARLLPGTIKSDAVVARTNGNSGIDKSAIITRSTFPFPTGISNVIDIFLVGMCSSHGIFICCNKSSRWYCFPVTSIWQINIFTLPHIKCLIGSATNVSRTIRI